MELISCPACGNNVSKNAPACSQCGEPIAGGSYCPIHSGHITTQEQTSKRFKLRLMLGWLGLLAGVIIAIAYDPTWGFVTIGIMAFWLFITKVSIWWNHA